MAITPLPQATIQLLGSAQVLTTPLSLVKELIDNALDAKATSIDIIISPNTIDKIEVRDNGHGIPQEDLNCLGTRGHTSKLRSFEELKTVGGISLGFRGEALASAVQLGEVTVTTKTEGEAIATTVKLKAPGGVASRTRASHPVGTTVSVAKFLCMLPVRRQTAVKERSKTLGKVKTLLQAYSLARPCIRLSLKLAKASKILWSFSPRVNDGIGEAVSNIIGRDATAQCVQKSFIFPKKQSPDLTTTEESKPSEPRSDQFIVEVFLPRPNASVIGHGQYTSIDSRPVSHDKGTMRKIITLFYSYLKGSLSGTQEKFKNPFIRLNLSCPTASYDPNVEPSKDDVIFENESLVLESLEQLLKEVYGEQNAAAVPNSKELLNDKLDSFELLMSRSKNMPSTSGSQPLCCMSPKDDPTPNHSSNSPTSGTPVLSPSINSAGANEDSVIFREGAAEDSGKSGRKWVVDTSKNCSTDVGCIQVPERQSQYSRPVRIPDSAALDHPEPPLNPWIIAKLNAPVREQQPSTPQTASTTPPLQVQSFLLTPQQCSDPLLTKINLLEESNGLTQPQQTFRADDVPTMAILNTHTISQPSQRESSLQLRDMRTDRRPSTAESSDDLLFVGDDSETFRLRNDFISARTAINDAIAPFTHLNGPKENMVINKRFVHPMRTGDKAIKNSLRQTRLTTEFYPSLPQNGIRHGNLEMKPNTDLAWAMDFEQRKEDATRLRRDELRAARLEANPSDRDDNIRSSPQRNRYNAAITSLHADQYLPQNTNLVDEPFRTSLPDGDPRAYLMRRQKSKGASNGKLGETSKLLRVKSTRLPLEKIPDEQRLHTLILRCPVDIDCVRNAILELANFDLYVGRGTQIDHLVMGPIEGNSVSSRVQTVVDKWLATKAGKGYEVGYRFENLIND